MASSQRLLTQIGLIVVIGSTSGLGGCDSSQAKKADQKTEVKESVVGGSGDANQATKNGLTLTGRWRICKTLVIGSPTIKATSKTLDFSDPTKVIQSEQFHLDAECTKPLDQAAADWVFESSAEILKANKSLTQSERDQKLIEERRNADSQMTNGVGRVAYVAEEIDSSKGKINHVDSVTLEAAVYSSYAIDGNKLTIARGCHLSPVRPGDPKEQYLFLSSIPGEGYNGCNVESGNVEKERATDFKNVPVYIKL